MLAVVAAVLAGFVLGRSSQEEPAAGGGPSSAATGTTATGPAGDPTADLATDAATDVAPAAADETTPAAPAESDPVSADPLGLGVAFADQPCTGEHLVILASSGSPRDWVTTLAPVIRKNPAARYLRTSSSCSVFNRAIDGKPIYAAYLGPFPDLESACVAREGADVGDAYARELSPEMDSRSLCSCLATADHPSLSRAVDAEPTVARQRSVSDAQALLYRAGYNPDMYLGGRFGPLTQQMVRAFQRDWGLAVTGRIDSSTWDALLGSC